MEQRPRARKMPGWEGHIFGRTRCRPFITPYRLVRRTSTSTFNRSTTGATTLIITPTTVASGIYGMAIGSARNHSVAVTCHPVIWVLTVGRVWGHRSLWRWTTKELGSIYKSQASGWFLQHWWRTIKVFTNLNSTPALTHLHQFLTYCPMRLTDAPCS